MIPPLMARFICAVHAPDAAPRALALVEQLPGDEPTYAVREMRTLDGDIGAVGDVLASERQYAGQTTLVTTGGQRAADALHAVGGAVAVSLLADSGGDADAHDVSAQVLVSTFERLYREGAVEAPGSLDLASAAIDALYTHADLDAAAADSDRDAEGDLDDSGETTLAGTSVAGRGPSPTVVEQSGSAAPVSTETVERPITGDEASAAAVDARERVARVASATGGEAPDLGEHEAAALALALACWYGEMSRDDLPETDQADEALANRVNRPNRRN